MSLMELKYIVRVKSMNLHEECLLKYLINPLDLFYTTELLKQNNDLIEYNLCKTNFSMQNNKISYSSNRV